MSAFECPFNDPLASAVEEHLERLRIRQTLVGRP